jgi:hypothetical protein
MAIPYVQYLAYQTYPQSRTPHALRVSSFHRLAKGRDVHLPTLQRCRLIDAYRQSLAHTVNHATLVCATNQAPARDE